MDIIFVLEVILFLLACALFMFIQSGQLSFIGIIVCATFIEFVKCYFSRKVAENSRLKNENQNLDEKMNDKKKEVPMVHSLVIYKMCQALEIKVDLVSVEERKAWIPEQKYLTNTKSGELNRTKKVPIVRSFMIHKICMALGLESNFDPLMEPTFFVRKQQNKRKSQEFVPLVKSISVFKICQGLGIKAMLAPPQEI
ncbi:hypothetical protein TNIN_345721 [Trichonephila inaurata madagascariensis]|uniref:Uncharacterized protein n=1 Tax=Trichonephila inaurata madagascariensis TaxID=2747483 RepID=A0A8X7CPM2_9ARAC|nr:hypothetical protein TNIN_345721 [Trichonephila inaurata madagascariensis]